MRPVYFHLLFEQHRADNLSIEKKKEKSENYATFFFLCTLRDKKNSLWICSGQLEQPFLFQ